jgi:solute carrier family 8 (sodium/calcium exchanger)
VFFLHYFHQIAAISDPEADGSIGNVVAANAIGVFLGLGFPWLVASIYWGQVEEI